jgi:DNA-binding transcriptional ArsR family regulator
MLKIRSTLRRDLLTWFKMNPGRRIWVRGLAQLIDADATNVSRELARLEGDGILKSDIEGRQRYYALDNDSPKVKPFFELMGDAIGVEATVAAVLGEVRGLEAVYVHVPRTKGTIPAEILLLLVGSASDKSLDAALNRVSGITGRPVKHQLLSQATAQRRRNAKDASLKEFWRAKPIALKQ